MSRVRKPSSRALESHDSVASTSSAATTAKRGKAAAKSSRAKGKKKALLSEDDEHDENTRGREAEGEDEGDVMPGIQDETLCKLIVFLRTNEIRNLLTLGF